jgi:hypothetical protein
MRGATSYESTNRGDSQREVMDVDKREQRFFGTWRGGQREVEPLLVDVSGA